MEIKRTITVNKPIDKVWDVLGNDFGSAAKWATGLYHSEGYGVPQLAGAACNNRSCDTNQGAIKEVVRVFDANNHHLAYEVIEGFPGFVKSGINNWRLTDLGNGKTKVDIHFIAVLQGIMGTLMKPMMKWQLGSTFDQVLEDFKVYVETGKPSAKKVKELKKKG
ncbi:SRPBCC family protein [Neolewinella persica]|uniref:SRPBCC family protein n=1 Tax=Neolewinella persica TaxID=70998 RepID=UPI00036D682B|nr:SRPBCC family protein [Neolewinella persica]